MNWKAYGVSNHNLKLQSKKFSRTRDICNFPTQGWADTAFYTHNWSETYVCVQELKKLNKKNLNKLHCATGYWLPCSLFKFFLKFLDQRCWRFSKGYLNNFSTELSSQIFYCCPRNFLIQEERIGNVVSTSHWIRPVLCVIGTEYVLQKSELPELSVGCSETYKCAPNCPILIEDFWNMFHFVLNLNMVWFPMF